MSATATKSPIKPTAVEPKPASVKVKPVKATQAVATVPKIAAPTKPKPISRDKTGVGAKAATPPSYPKARNRAPSSMPRYPQVPGFPRPPKPVRRRRSFPPDHLQRWP